MPLNTPALKSALKAAFAANIPSPTTVQLAQLDVMCGVIANAIQSYIQGATITYTSGLMSGSGPVSGVFGNTIS